MILVGEGDIWVSVKILLFVDLPVNLIVETIVEFLVVGEVLSIFIERRLNILKLLFFFLSFVLPELFFYIFRSLHYSDSMSRFLILLA